MSNIILYIKENVYECKLYCEEGIKDEISIRSFIQRECKRHLFSIEDYKKNIRRFTILKNKIPIYFNKDYLLFYLSDETYHYLINYKALVTITYIKNSPKVTFHFKSGDILEMNINLRHLKRELKKIQVIEEYINGL